MARIRVSTKDWSQMVDPPALSARDWNMSSLLGIVLIVMAVLQLISFSSFKAWLGDIGLSAETAWAVGLVVAELVAAAGFFKLKLMRGFRMLSALAAVFVGGFWFFENLRLISEGKAGLLANSGLFGKYLPQNPGWWTALEVTVLLFWVVYSLELFQTAAKRK